jgi:hypothetical protein
MAVAPTDYVLKAYMSEADAIADTNALYVNSSTDGTLSNATLQSGTTTDDAGNTTFFHFYIFEKYWFRIESNELSTAFEIDWDDGEDNSAEKSNTTLLSYENPRFVGIASKILTKHGAHYPLIRAKNVEGFWSKWYTPYSTTNDLSTVHEDMQHFRAQYDSGLNTSYTVSMEKINKPRIPILVPASKPPTGVLKVDRKKVFSGIDNTSLLLADGRLYVTCDNTVRDDVAIRIIYENNANLIKETLLSIAGGVGNIGTNVSDVRRVLRIELMDARETTSATVTNKLASGERLYLYNDTPSSHRGDPVIGYVSTGNPLLSLEEPGNYLIADGTESSTKAQNVSIKQYYFDTDKLYFTTGSTSTTGGTQTIDTSHYYTDNFKTGVYTGPFLNGAQKISYSLDYKADLLDEHNRILPQTRLIRLQVEDTGADTDVDTTTDLLRRSYVESFRKSDYTTGDLNSNGTIDVTTANNFVQRRPDSLKNYSQFVSTKDLTGNDTNPNWGDMQDVNWITGTGDSSKTLDGSIHSYNSVFTAMQNLSQAPRHFWFMANKKLFDRLHFRTAFQQDQNTNPPIHDNSGTDPDNATFPSIELQMWYPAWKDSTRTTIIWKPLKYVDGTRYNKNRGTSLSRSGVVSWDIPEDWIQTKHYYNASPTASAPTVIYSMGGSDFPDDDTTGHGIEDAWTVDSYALIIGFAGDRSNVSNTDIARFEIQSCTPFSNSHSQVVEVIDPTCISLNDFAIAQSISFVRKGKFQKIENRLGTAEIRKIGVEGGAVKFGGLDLRADPKTMRKKMYEYQKDAVPVYIYFTNKNNDFTRFFGVITEMSEDHPTGSVIPKFALSMVISKIGMFNSSGRMISDGLVSLGGEIDDKPDYVGFGGQWDA